ncbi:VanZ like family protein [Robiginitalea myxolifaciens]|uniref:VanZ like family protein n=1 Tax=Robiginitalea myxolifaciens TaxID=400055 RepID=A0A1I6FT79_9FLAO|nr:VanZ family protein [Robiginitalea myxolifaciens]SFR33155.1 VanZ like family protein [Robiginitalea myxolifaciens]
MRSTRNSSGPKPGIFTLGLILWLAGIVVACLMPVDDFSEVGMDIPYMDKAAHFVFYFGAMILAGLTIKENTLEDPSRGRWVRRAVFGLLLFGLAIEGLQLVLPAGRSAQWGDLVANGLGLFAGLASLKRGFHELLL